MMNKYSYSVKEIADILGVSKTAIQKHIKAYNISYDYVDKNKYFYSKEKTIAIIKGIRTDFNISEIDKATQEIANRQPKTENQQPTTDNRFYEASAVGYTEPKELYSTIGVAYTKYPFALLTHEADLEATYFFNT